jgi:hypothetical protein
VKTSRTVPRSLVVLLLAALGAVLHLQAAPTYHPGHKPDHAVTVTVGSVKFDAIEPGAATAIVAKAAGSRSAYGKEQVRPPAHPVVLSRSASSRLLLPSDRGQLATCARGADPRADGGPSASGPSQPVSLRPGAATALLQVFRC